MQHRRLGGKLEVSALGLGCMGMSEAYGPHNDMESLGTLHHALEQGITFFDTADLYGDGHNETLVGRAMRGRRKRVAIATKFGIRGRDGKGGWRVDGRPAVRGDRVFPCRA